MKNQTTQVNAGTVVRAYAQRAHTITSIHSIERWNMGEEVDHRDTVLRSGLKFFSHKFIPPLEKLGVSWERQLLKERLSFRFASQYIPRPPDFHHELSITSPQQMQPHNPGFPSLQNQESK